MSFYKGEGGGFTGEGSGAREGEDAGVAAKVTELAVGKTGEDFAAVAAEEFEVVAMGGRGAHHWVFVGFSGNEWDWGFGVLFNSVKKTLRQRKRA